MHGWCAASSGLGHVMEYAVLDRFGRLQLPPEMSDALGLRQILRARRPTQHHSLGVVTHSIMMPTSSIDTQQDLRLTQHRERGRITRGCRRPAIAGHAKWLSHLSHLTSGGRDKRDLDSAARD
jgi:hypothetical protein